MQLRFGGLVVLCVTYALISLGSASAENVVTELGAVELGDGDPSSHIVLLTGLFRIDKP